MRYRTGGATTASSFCPLFEYLPRVVVPLSCLYNQISTKGTIAQIFHLGIDCSLVVGMRNAAHSSLSNSSLHILPLVPRSQVLAHIYSIPSSSSAQTFSLRNTSYSTVLHLSSTNFMRSMLTLLSAMYLLNMRRAASCVVSSTPKSNVFLWFSFLDKLAISSAYLNSHFNIHLEFKVFLECSFGQVSLHTYCSYKIWGWSNLDLL